MEEKLLTPLRDVALPPSAVDLHRAVRDGRRQVRRRRIATAATAGLAVVAVLAAAPAVLGQPDRPAPFVPGFPSPTSASVAPMPDRAPTAFDPGRQYADFGWLPAGLTDRMVATGTAQLALNASPPMDPASSDRTGGAQVELRIVAAGHGIALEGANDFAVPSGRAGSADLEPAEPVNGRTARWNRLASDARGAALRWEYAPGAWAEVTVQAVSEGSDPRALARRIAEDVRYGVDRPIRLPVRFANLPAGLKPMAYRVGTSAGGSWNVELSYGSGRRTKYGDWPLVVLMIPRLSPSGDNSVLGGPDSTIDGHPARRRSSPDGGASLQVYGVQGLYVEMSAHDQATLRKLGGNLDSLFRGATLYPKVKDWR
ncbi:hypothetical protein ABZ570_11930 [Micromonospora sp. NPDC007271]|uniref:hypothetical protein n=1 Tax=Micromonospora sp. NPDC007271 TaxID=3154587 RepID=UPI0033CDD212